MFEVLKAKLVAVFKPQVQVSEKKVVVKKSAAKPKTTPIAGRKGAGFGTRYDDATHQKVIRLLLEGKTHKEVTELTGVTLSAVGYMASHYKKNVGPLPRSKKGTGTWLTRQKVREVYTYRGKGFTWDEIQERTGVNKDVVGDILRDRTYTRYTKDMTDYK